MVPDSDYAVAPDVAAQFPDYLMVIPLGRGSQGTVYQALQCRTERPVAIKVLHHQADEVSAQRFCREIAVLAQLKHPNIVTLIDYGILENDRPYYVMHCVEQAEDISLYVWSRELDVRRRIQLLAQVCDAVGYAHERGFVHRDLKPSNIIVDETGVPFILDFGLAKALAGNDLLATSSFNVSGTLPYMAPEHTMGVSGTRSDVYSLGVICYQLLVGRTPVHLDGASPADVVRQILNPDIAGMRRAVRSAAGSDLAAIVLKALASDKNERYGDARELHCDLQAALDGRAVKACAGLWMYRVRRGLKRHGVLAGALAAVAVCGVLALGWVQGLRRGYGAALAMGGIQRMASVERDGSRVDQAEQLLEESLLLGRGLSGEAVDRRACIGHRRLAELHLTEDRLLDAERHIHAATALVERYLRKSPDDLEWQRLAGFVYRIAGSIAAERSDWRAADGYFGNCAAVRRRLVEVDPDNPTLREELAAILVKQASSARHQHVFALARAHYEEALHLRTELHLQNPESVDRLIKRVYAEHSMAVLHLSSRQTADDVVAARYLLNVTRLLDDNAARLLTHPRRVDRLRQALRDNVTLVTQRLLNSGVLRIRP